MTWQRIGKTISIGQAFAGVHTANTWLFRTDKNVVACDPESSTVQWEVNLDNQQKRIGPKVLAVAGDLVVTVEDFGYKRPTQVIAVKPQSGEVAWRCKVDGKLAQFGLAVFNEDIWLHIQQKRQDARLVQLNASDGVILAEFPSNTANGIRVAADRLFVPRWDGLYVLDNTKSPPSRLTESHAHLMTAKENAIYFYETPASRGEPLKVCYLDGVSEQTVGQVECLNDSVNIEGIIPLSKPEHVAVLHSSGFLLLDLQLGVVLATVQLSDGEQALSMVWTPDGLVLAYLAQDYNCKVKLYDNQTAKCRGELPVEDLSPAVLFYIDKRLIVSGSVGIAFFT